MSHRFSHINHLIACPLCDALCQQPETKEGQKVVCKMCGGKIYDHKVNSINRTFFIALAGLLIFLPAINLPLIGISAIGLSNQASLLDCVILFIHDGYPVIAFALFVFTVAMPLVKLGSAFYVAGSVKFNRINPSLLYFFRTYHQLDSWTMLHVFLLGIVVSMYKLVSMASLSIGLGFIAFVMLLLCSTLVSVTLDHHLIWHKLSEARDG